MAKRKKRLRRTKPKPFDPTLKTLVETSPNDWPRILKTAPGLVSVVDSDTSTVVSGAADKVLRVDNNAPYILALDFQSGHDSAQLPIDLNLRNLVLEKRHELPVHTFAVLLRPEADSPMLSGERTRTLPGQKKPYNVFNYDVLRVWTKPPKLFLSGGLGMFPLAPISAVSADDIPAVFEEMRERLEADATEKQAADVWAATRLLMGLRYSQEFTTNMLIDDRILKHSSTYQQLRAEAIAEGAAKSKEKWSSLGAIRMLAIVARTKFGKPTKKQLATLNKCKDLALIEQLGTRVMSLGSWAELIAELTAASKDKK